MRSADIILHEAVVELEFENPLDAHHFNRRYNDAYHQDILRLIEDRLTPYKHDNIFVEEITLTLPDIHAECFDTDFLTELNNSLSDYLNPVLNDTPFTFSGLVQKQTLHESDAAHGDSVKTLRESADRAQISAKELRSVLSTPTLASQKSSFAELMNAFIAQIDDVGLNQQVLHSLQLSEQVSALAPVFISVAQQRVSGYALQSFAKLLSELSANKLSAILSQLFSLKPYQLDAAVNDYLMSQKHVQSNNRRANKDKHTVASFLSSLDAAQKQYLVLALLQQIQRSHTASLAPETLPGIVAKSLAASKTSGSDTTTSSEVESAKESAQSHFTDNAINDLNASPKELTRHYFETVLEALVSPTILKPSAKIISEQTFFLLIMHAPHLLNKMLNKPMTSSSLYRLCSRLNDECLVQLCNSYCAQYALSPPTSAIDYCWSKEGLEKPFAWMYFIQFLIMENTYLQTNDEAIEFVRVELSTALRADRKASETNSVTSDTSADAKRPPVSSVSASIQKSDIPKQKKHQHATPANELKSSGQSNKQVVHQLQKLSLSEGLKDYFVAYETGSFSASHIARYYDELENLAHKKVVHKKVEHKNTLYVNQALKTHLLVWFESIVRLPVLRVLESGRAYSWKKARIALIELINIYALLTKQDDAQHQYTSLSILKSTVEQFTNKHHRVMTRRLRQELEKPQSKAQARVHRKASSSRAPSSRIPINELVGSTQLSELMQFAFTYDILVQVVKRGSFTLSEPQLYTANKILWYLLKSSGTQTSQDLTRAADTRTLTTNQPIMAAADASAANKAKTKVKLASKTYKSYADFQQQLKHYINDPKSSIAELQQQLLAITQFDKQHIIQALISEPVSFALQQQHAPECLALVRLFSAHDIQQSRQLLSALSLLIKRSYPAISSIELRVLEWQSLLQLHQQLNLRFQSKWLTRIYLGFIQKRQPKAYHRLLTQHSQSMSDFIRFAQLPSEHVSEALSVFVDMAEQYLDTAQMPRGIEPDASPSTHREDGAPKPNREALSTSIEKAISLGNEEQVGLPSQLAGLVLLHPYLPRLFDMFELTHNGSFTTQEDQLLARSLLVYLATGDANTPCQNYAFLNIMCGLPESLGAFEQNTLALTPEEVTTVELLLTSLIEHWSIGKTSIAGLRETFLIREGFVSKQDTANAYLIRIEFQAFDVLLERLPWQISTIKLPWQKAVIELEWKHYG